MSDDALERIAAALERIAAALDAPSAWASGCHAPNEIVTADQLQAYEGRMNQTFLHTMLRHFSPGGDGTMTWAQFTAGIRGRAHNLPGTALDVRLAGDKTYQAWYAVLEADGYYNGVKHD